MGEFNIQEFISTQIKQKFISIICDEIGYTPADDTFMPTLQSKNTEELKTILGSIRKEMMVKF